MVNQKSDTEGPSVHPKRKRTGGIDVTPKSSFGDLMKGKLALELSLSDRDRQLIRDDIVKKIEEVGDKVDYRWKITQWLMVLAISLGVIGEAVKYL